MWKKVAYFLFMFLVIVYFWKSPFIFPVKFLVVLLHEMSHGIAAVLTGGKIVKITISPYLGGVCHFKGGWMVVAAPAGYLGSMLWGCLLMLLATERKMATKISIGFGILLLLVTIIYVRSWVGIVVGIGFGLFFLFLGLKASPFLNKFFLQFIGFTSSLYAIIDIKEDLIDRTVCGSDAYVMSKILFFPPVFWGILWILIAIVVTYYTLKWAIKMEE